MNIHDRCTMAIEVLQKTRDGEDLSPQDLWVLQEWVNAGLNEAGEAHFHSIYERVIAGTYQAPWLCGIEHLTRNHQGYVFWKGVEVEHYSFHGEGAEEREKEAAMELARRCLLLEALGIQPTYHRVIWDWDPES